MTVNPDGDRIGAVPLPEPQEYELLGRDDRPFSIYGRLLGYADSRRTDHEHDPYFIDVADMRRTLALLPDRIQDLQSRWENDVIPTPVYAVAIRELRAYRALLSPEFAGSPENVRRYASTTERCSACRWFEVRIFSVEGEYTDNDVCTCNVTQVDGDGDDDEIHDITCGLDAPRARYLVLTYGHSEVPGEIGKRRAAWTNSHYEVISILTQRQRSSDSTRSTTTKFMPVTSERALAQAASVDPDIERAFNARNVR